MKTQIKNYTFNKTAKTVTFTDYTTIDLDSILLIVNVTDNIIIYNFANPALGGAVTSNYVTLTFDTAAMDNADKLLIYYDDAAAEPATAQNQATMLVNETIIIELTQTLAELSARLQVLASMANSGAPALRTIPIASISTAVSGSLTTVTNLTNFGTGMPAREIADDINNYTAIIANINNVTP